MMNKRIALIGAGNVAHHLAQALLKSGFNLCQIYSRTIESARELGMKTGISYTNELYAIYPDCDIYIFCLNDDALQSVYKSIRVNKNALILHTSGSVSMDIFKDYVKNYGVLYPLQTFSKKRDLSFKEIPLCIEASNAQSIRELRKIAEELSHCVEEVSSENRLILHLAAVFACNFTNHLYQVAGKIVAANEMDFSILRPLIYETAHKVMTLQPEEAQTGPAARNDDTIINKHKALLKEQKQLQTIYTLLTNSIKSNNIKNEEKVVVDDKQMSLW
ncbi:DUF2520 domain-containing protein [Odoribacter sp. OttesenSCG-928-J03]|nr:DUF2520 domain-containing protein [Odoribacter sp. OttesenSCG-928-J03]